MCASPSIQFRKQFQNKRMKIQRHKVPNISKIGNKFDQPSVAFFQKISCTYKLLEEPYQIREQPDQMEKQLRKIAMHQRKGMSSRLRQLSQPKPMKNSQTHKQQFVTSFQIQKPKNGTKGNRTKIFSTSFDLQNKNSITGTNLGLMPTDQILAIKEKQQEQEFIKNYNYCKNKMDHQDDEEENSQQDGLSSKEQNIVPITDNLLEWSDKIIKGQNKLYQQYQKTLMQKVKGYRRKQLKMNHKHMWK